MMTREEAKEILENWNFCHNCGAAQTRGAVEMVMERMEELHESP